ncbi:MAG: thioredoxin domain-containing protein [Desulfosarcinaceae bacterium]|jgi:thioredoxin 2
MARAAGIIITCPRCGTKNRIPETRLGQAATCGSCHETLPGRPDGVPDRLTLRCGACHTKNRVPVEKLFQSPKCGQCGRALEGSGLLSGHALIVGDKDFDQIVTAAPLPLIVYAWASWCSVCGTTGPMVERLAWQGRGRFQMAKLNVEANPVLATRYNLLSVPSFMIFDNGQLKESIPGAIPEEQLLQKLKPFLPH